jgi:FkbM family methyltransferase
MPAKPRYIDGRRPGDDHIWNEMHEGNYEFYKGLKEGDYVVDAGGHAGFFATYAAEKIGPTGKVFSFECEPSNYAVLKENSSSYGNVVVHPVALWNEETILTLNLSHSSAEHSIIQKQPNATEIRVYAEKLDDVYTGTKLDFFKIDVERAELQVLQGAESIIRAFKPHIAMEVEPYDIDKVRDFLLALGFYHVHNRKSEGIGGAHYLYALPICETCKREL